MTTDSNRYRLPLRGIAPSQSKRIQGSLRLVLGLGLFLLVGLSIDWQEEGRLLRHVVWGWVLAALGLHLLNRVFNALKWQILLRAKGFTNPFSELLRIVWISNFFGHFLPSVIGGDSLRMWQVARHSERAPEAVSTVAVERLTGVTSLAALALLGGLWSAAHWGEHAIIMALLAPITVLLAGLALLWTVPGERLLQWLLSHVQRLPGYEFLRQVQQAIHSFRQEPRAVCWALAISGLIQFVRVLAVLSLARAVGVTLFFGEALVLVPSAIFIAMLPLTIGGLGLHEGAFVILLGFANVGHAAAFGLAILSRLATLASNLPGGVLFLLEGFVRPDPTGASNLSGRRLRVLWVADKLGYGDRLHGLGHYYLHVLPELRAVDAIPVALRSHHGAGAAFRARGLELRELHRRPYDPRALWSLVRLIRREQADVLQLHGYGASLLGRLAGRLTGVPVILRQGDSVPESWLVRRADSLLRALAVRTIAVSESVKQFCIMHRGIPPERVVVLPNAVAIRSLRTPEELRRYRRAQALPEGAKVVGSVTRFHPIKGVRYLIEAMPAVVAAVPDAYLVLWGDGPERATLAAQAEALGVAGRVRFLGYQPDAMEWLGLLDCFVLPSVSEGSPNALLEALAAGRPAVAARVGGIAERVRDGEEALLVPPQDQAAISGAVIRILQDGALARRLGEAAQRMSQQYSMAGHVGALEQLYRQVVADHRRLPAAVAPVQP